MVIKNRDGSVYKLRGPNPIVQEQHTWDKYVVHNMVFKQEFSQDTQEIIPIVSDLNLTQDFVTELNQTAPIPEIKESISLSKEPEPVISPEKPKELNKVDIYCLPATIRERRDILYDEKYQTIQYGKPFLFEAVIVKEEDLYIELWTNVKQSISNGSVIYPKKGTKRWWKITEQKEKSNGWLLTGVFSEYTPAFSEIS